MSRTPTVLDEGLAAFVHAAAARVEDDLLRRLRDETAVLPQAQMQISVEQGRLMHLLASALGVRRAIEVGVFTGYSSISVARALPKDGLLVACDVSVEWTSVARRYWAEAGVDDRIDLRIGPGAETLAAMLAAGEAGTYDFAFVDADKEGYPGYYEQCLELLRPGGLLVFDNAFQHGRVVDPAPDDRSGRAVRGLIDAAVVDPRVEAVLAPVADGLLFVRKRAGGEAR